MERQQFNSLGFNMGFCLNFYLKLKHLIVLNNNQEEIRKKYLKTQIFQIVTITPCCLFHVKQAFFLINKSLFANSVSCFRNVSHEIIFRIDRSYIQFTMPLTFVKDGVAKASGFAL